MHRLYDKMIRSQLLQDMAEGQQDERVLYYYRETMKKYLAERHLIPEGQLVEIGFDELEQDAMGTIEKVYRDLGIDGLEAARPEMLAYLDSVSNYEKNVFRQTEPEVAEKLMNEWAFAFEEWGYAKERQGA